MPAGTTSEAAPDKVAARSCAWNGAGTASGVDSIDTATPEASDRSHEVAPVASNTVGALSAGRSHAIAATRAAAEAPCAGKTVTAHFGSKTTSAGHPRTAGSGPRGSPAYACDPDRAGAS